jgi:hypothetical protein
MAPPIYKIAKLSVHALIIGLLVAILVLLVRGQGTSGYEIGSPITIKSGPNAQKDPKDLFGITPSVECVPGPGEKADYYTMGLTPGGLCGGSAMVRDQMRDYAVADGIGGSLLEN